MFVLKSHLVVEVVRSIEHHLVGSVVEVVYDVAQLVEGASVVDGRSHGAETNVEAHHLGAVQIVQVVGPDIYVRVVVSIEQTTTTTAGARGVPFCRGAVPKKRSLGVTMSVVDISNTA
jgi:hypothetical protein